MFSPEELQKLDVQLDTGALLLVPNYRCSRQLQDALMSWRQTRNRSIVQRTPAILPVDLWLSDLWRQVALHGNESSLADSVLSAEQEILLWRQAIGRSPLGAKLLNPDGSARDARDAWRLLRQWQVPIDGMRKLDAKRLNGLDDAPHLIFGDWAARFLESCKKYSVLSLSDQLARLLKLYSNDPAVLAPFLPSRLLLWGFDAPPPLYQSLFVKFSQAGLGMHELQSEIYQPDNLNRSCHQTSDEILAAALWAKEIFDAQPDACIGIICPELDNLQTLARRTFGRVFGNMHRDSWLVTGNEKLIDASFVHLALQLPRLSEKPEGSFHEASCDTLTLCQLLRSPWLLGHVEEADGRAEIEILLREQGETTSSLATFRELCLDKDNGRPALAPKLGTVLLTYHSEVVRSPDKAPFQFWLGLITSLWQSLLDENRLKQHETAAVLKGWLELKELLWSSCHLQDSCSLQEAISTIQILAKALPLPGILKTAPVMVMSLVASAGMRFTHCWCLQMNERQWPGEQHANPLLSLALQREHNMPGTDPTQPLVDARQQLQRLQASTTQHFVCSWSLNDESSELRPSALLPHAPVQHVVPDEFPSELHPCVAHSGFGLALGVNQTSSLPPDPDQEYVGNSNLLGDQAACPFRSFALNRLAAIELKVPRYGLPPHAVGSCIHRMLEYFWEHFTGSSELGAADPQSITRIANDCTRRALHSLARDYPATLQDRYLGLEQQRLAALLQRWLLEERKRGPFLRLETEQSHQWQHGKLRLKLRIDRIDEDLQGQLVIIDYKSGKLPKVDWEAERQDQPQLLLYLQALEKSGVKKPVAALLHARVNIEEPGYKGIGINDDIHPGIAYGSNKNLSLPDWHSLKMHWEASLQRLAQEFLDGYVAVSPLRRDTCQYCHLEGLCRIGEMRSHLEVTDEADHNLADKEDWSQA